jgi:hypothetical protein
MSPALIALAVTAIALAVSAPLLARQASRAPGAAGPTRPLWATPAVWIAASVALVLLGVLVFPRLLGFTILLLPFIWMRSGGRRPGSRPREPEE